MVADEQRFPDRRDRFRTRVRYNFDNLLSRGMWAVLAWLGALAAMTVLVSSLLLAAFDVTFSGSADTSWLEDFWQSLLRVIDPGTMAGDVGWGRRMLALLITLFGLLIGGTLIGLIATGIEQRVEAMRQGRSTVVESGHVVILGASDRLSIVIDQLAIANQNRRRDTIVVLADLDATGIDHHVRNLASNVHGSRIVLRWGDPTRTADLSMVSLREARVVIALADERTRGDAGVVKAVLAAGVELGGFGRLPIVAELSDTGTAESLVRACGESVHPVAGMQAVARITAFAMREPGLNQVVEELLDFRGCDIIVRELGDAAGLSFAETVFLYEKARPIGRMRPNGEPEINPDPGTRFEAGDRIIMIADDDGVAAPATVTAISEVAVPTVELPWLRTGRPEEHLLIVGWNPLGTQLLAQWEQFAAPSSSVEIVFDAGLFDSEDLEIPRMDGIEVTKTPIRTPTWQLRPEDHVSHLTSIVFLGYRRDTSVEEADSRTLLNLMLLRRVLEGRDGAFPQVIVELLSPDNVDLARTAGGGNFIVSDAIVSRLIAQLAVQPERRAVFLGLYAAGGPSVHLVDATDLGLAEWVRYDEVIATAYALGMLAIGWRRSDSSGGDVVLNPSNSERIHLEKGDQIVVIG